MAAIQVTPSPMPKNADTPNDLGFQAKITNSGLSVKVKSRAFGMLDAFLGSLGIMRLAKLQNEANRIRSKGRLEEAVCAAAVEKIKASVGQDTEIDRLVGAIAVGAVHGMVNKLHVAEHAASVLANADLWTRCDGEVDSELEPDLKVGRFAPDEITWHSPVNFNTNRRYPHALERNHPAAV